MKHIYRSTKQWMRKLLEWTNLGYRLSLWRDHRVITPRGLPQAPWANAVLNNHEEVRQAVEQVARLKLPPMRFPPKNWDSLAALDIILKNTTPDAHILDAGGEQYSVILPWLFLYGYEHLVCGNLVFDRPIKKGPIRYLYADITKTDFPDGAFDAITCLSVVEHGVELAAYFREMSRILKPGGLLITSTDYFETPIDTKGQVSLGCPIHIFTKGEILQLVQRAEQFGLRLVGPLDLACDEKVVWWDAYDLRYTFVIISMRKCADSLRSEI